MMTSKSYVFILELGIDLNSDGIYVREPREAGHRRVEGSSGLG